MSDYSSLRRRTRDASWQWLVMGIILGLGIALVVCVGGYALGALTFPVLEADTVTPRVEIQPNQTEVAMQLTPAEAETDSAADLTEEAADITGEGAQAAPEVSLEPTDTPEQAAAMTPSPLPSTNDPAGAVEETTPPAVSLADPGAAEGAGPGGEVAGDPPAQAPDTTAQDAVEGQAFAAAGEATGDQSGAALAQGTPIVGTPPVGSPTPTIPFTNRPAVPPELQRIQSSRVTIPGGTFQMGTTMDEGLAAVDECALYEAMNCTIEMVQDSVPPHPVTVDSFEIETTEVSLAQFVEFLNFMGPESHTNGCAGQPCAVTKLEEPLSYIGYDGTTYSVDPALFTNYPAIWVTWWGAEAYCNALNGRLPTEAEWERAARGEANNIYPWGSTFDVSLANSNRPRSEADGPEPVDSYSNGRTATGLYNMAGNVAEWVQDWYAENYYSQLASDPAQAVNPFGPVSGSQKVIRGGSWDTVPLFLRAVHRQSWPPGDPKAFIGFRCVFENPNIVAPPSSAGQTGDTLQDGGLDAAPGAPTLGAPPTQRPTNTPGPTATLAPG